MHCIECPPGRKKMGNLSLVQPLERSIGLQKTPDYPDVAKEQLFDICSKMPYNKNAIKGDHFQRADVDQLHLFHLT